VTVILLLLAMGCTRSSSPETGPLLDTGWFEDSAGDTDDTGACADLVTAVDAEGAADWYWRAGPRVTTSSERHEAYDARLIDPIGVEAGSTLAWDGLGFSVVPEEPLAPLTAYTLEVTDCLGAHTYGFSTSDLGLPLQEGPSALVNRTFAVDLRDATWVEPAGFGALLSLYFDTPILLGVEWADSRTLDLLGAQGFYSGSDIYQSSDPTWDYPLASFEGQPYFEAASDQVDIDISGAATSIYGFELEGTFAADGERFGGGTVSGLGDTRYLGPLINLGDDPNAICGVAADMGATCVDCPDGQPYCLFLAAEDVVGVRVPGLVLDRVEE
jgi:hypothetical protein